MFSGSIPALVTPFRGGVFDEAAFRRLVDWQIEQGSSALVPCGTTGEASTLSNAEPLDAEIVLIDHYIDSASNTFRVRAALPNADGKIPPGSRCSVELMELPAAAQSQAASVPASAPPTQSK